MDCGAEVLDCRGIVGVCKGGLPKSCLGAHGRLPLPGRDFFLWSLFAVGKLDPSTNGREKTMEWNVEQRVAEL